MARDPKSIQAEVKALENLAAVEARLLVLANRNSSAARREKRELKEKKEAIEKYVEKLKLSDEAAKDASDTFKEMTESMSLSSRATSNMSKSLSVATKNFRGIQSAAKAMLNEGVDNLPIYNASQEIAKAASDLMDAQQSILNAGVDLTAAEAEELNKNLTDASTAFTSIITNNKDLLKTQPKLNQYVSDLVGSFQSINRELEITNGLTKEEIDQYKELTAEGEKLKAKFKSIGDMITTAIKKPAVLLGAAIMAIGQAVSKLGENFREFGGDLGGAVYSATALSLVFKEGTSVAKGLASEFGSMKDTSFDTLLNTNLLAVNLGLSGEETTKLVGGFARLNGNSKDVAFNMIASAKAMSEAAGLNTSAVMQDISSNMGKFAEYSSDGGQNLIEAGIAAAKLGVTLDTVASVADSLLDFEQSITKELELGALLGRNINLNEARTLAYRGKTGAALKSVIRELGGIQAFNDMDVYAKRETAALLGISVGELQKMSENMGQLNDDGTMQLSTFDKTNELLTALATGPMGTLISSMGALIMLGIQLGFQWSFIKGAVDRVTASIMQMNAAQNSGTVTSTLAGGAGGAGQRLRDSRGRFMASPRPTPTPPPPGGGGMSFLDKIGSPGQILSLAVALLAFGGAVFVIAKAFEVFGNVTNMGQALVGFGAAILGMGLSIGILSAVLAPLATTGILQLVALGFIAFGAAVALVGFGIQMAAEGFSIFTSSLGNLITQIPPLFSMIPQIFGISAAFAALGYSLGLVGTLGLAGVGVLLAAGTAAAGLSMLMGESEQTTAIEGGSLEQTVKDGLQNVVDAINKKNFDVYLDRSKVTNLIMNEERSKTRNNTSITPRGI
jgi:hypothetical protein